MLKFTFWILKMGILTVVILVLSHWIEIQGRTVSDHVKMRLSSTRFVRQSLRAPALPELERIEKSERQKLRKLLEDLNR